MQLRLPDGTKEIVPQSSAEKWEAVIDKVHKNSEINIAIVGVRHNGQEYKADLTHSLGQGGGVKKAKVKLPATVLQHSASQPVKSEPKVESETDEKHDEAETAIDDKEDKEKTATEGGKLDWLNVGGIIAGINIVFGLIIFIFIILFRKWRKRRLAAANDLDLEL